jgi:hypothetical protein
VDCYELALYERHIGDSPAILRCPSLVILEFAGVYGPF